MMDTETRTHYDNLSAKDGSVRYEALNYMLALTEHPVEWAYEVWDELVTRLSHKDNHQRAIAAQLLCHLAKSDPEKRLFNDFEALLAVTKDEKFVTARHTLQALWRVGTAGSEYQHLLVDGFTKRFVECATEKNCTLIRYDIIKGLKELYDVVGDTVIREQTLALIETESDDKYRRKYVTVWKNS